MSSPVGPPPTSNDPNPQLEGDDPPIHRTAEPVDAEQDSQVQRDRLHMGYAGSRPDLPWTAGAADATTADPTRRIVEPAPRDFDAGAPTTRIEHLDRSAPPPPPVLLDPPVAPQPVAPRPVVERPVAALPPDRKTVVARERERFGGMKFGAGFFGWLTATGLAVLLLAILAAAGVAFGITSNSNVNQAVQQANSGTGTAKTVGLVGAIVLLVILFLAYYAGSYVAGRMARFDGFKQGLGVWLWAIITTAVIAAVAAIAGSKYNILANLNLPRIPVKEGAVTTVGIIAIAAALLAALLGALLGGKVGTRYHRKVDAAGYLEQ